MLPCPNLDDRDFAALVAEAREVIAQRCPAWSDRSENDPGMVLVEVFAHLTDVLLYRLNQVPDRVHIALLNLLGVTVDPPSAAQVTLEVSVDEPQTSSVVVPASTEVTVSQRDADAPVFRTMAAVEIAAGDTTAQVEAIHARRVEAEFVGRGTGRPGQALRVARPPMVVAPIAPARQPGSDDGGRRLVVAVEIDPAEGRGDLDVEGRPFAIWSEVPGLRAGVPPRSYVVDLVSGVIQFGSAAGPGSEPPIEVPPAGKEVRAWYWTGGGPAGNVDAGTLTTLVTPLPHVSVVNPSGALGGRSMESLDSARRRGAGAIHSMDACVTRQDYERVACRHGAVARARAMTRAAVWRHAEAGEVEVVLVPAIEGDHPVDTQLLHQHQDESVRTAVEAALRERQPLGSTTEVSWANVRTASARVALRVRPEENPVAVRDRVVERLHGTITPLRTPFSETGWPFGRDLYASDIYDIVLSEPAVSHVERVRLVLDNVPASDVRSISRDWYQDQTWFVAAGAGVFRTRDDGSSWEALRIFDGEEVTHVEAHPGRDVERGGPARRGFVALVRSAESEQGPTSTVMVSRDLGESWVALVTANYEVSDVAWIETNAQPGLLLATERGLFRASVEPGVPAVPVLVDPGQPELGFFAVTAHRRANGVAEVAAASMGGGVFGSTQGGKAGTFERWTLARDVRVLESEYRESSTFVWAGAIEGSQDVAPFRMNRDDATPSFTQITDGWTGEGCTAIAFGGGPVVAGSYSSGVLRLARTETAERWERAGIDVGLPIRDEEGFLLEPVTSLAMRADLVLAGTPSGVFRQDAPGERYEAAATEEFTDSVNLPDGWLFCSGQHQVEVS
jgi:Baseplate J-like protein